MSPFALSSGHTSITDRMFQSSSNLGPPPYVNPAEIIHNGFPALRGDPMATNVYGTRPISFSGESNHAMEDPW